MKNIYFGLAIATILTFSACGENETGNNEQSEPSSSSDLSLSSSSSSNPIVACYISANISPAMKFSLCWEGATMTQEKCNAIIHDYQSLVTSYEMKSSCPDSEDNCNSEKGYVYRYNHGTGPIPMACASLLPRL